MFIYYYSLFGIMVSFLVKEEEGIRKYDKCLIVTPKDLSSFSHPLRLKIIEMLEQKPMFISEIAKKLNLNEQNVYYHMKDMLPMLDVVDEKKVRGTVAKKYAPKAMNFCVALSDNFKDYKSFTKKAEDLHPFFMPFIKNDALNARIIVGNPDPHGPYKARARDGHYAVELAMYLGNLCKLPQKFSVAMDVDVDLENCKENLILVGGPVTNLIMGKINEFLPVKFTEEKHWAIKGKRDVYTDDNIGMIASIPHPFSKNNKIMIIAGIRFSGTKSAVIGLTRKTRLSLAHYTGQENFYSIVQGFDLDGDGKIDSAELIESQ